MDLNQDIIVRVMGCNMGNIAAGQVRIFFDNLIYQGYITEIPGHGVKVEDKLYFDLKFLG